MWGQQAAEAERSFLLLGHSLGQPTIRRPDVHDVMSRPETARVLISQQIFVRAIAGPPVYLSICPSSCRRKIYWVLIEEDRLRHMATTNVGCGGDKNNVTNKLLTIHPPITIII